MGSQKRDELDGFSKKGRVEWVLEKRDDLDMFSKEGRVE